MRKMFIVGLGSLAAALALGASTAGAQSAGGCQLQGEAHLSPGLNSSSQPFRYDFGGNLEGCNSTQAGAPASGTVAAGQTVAEQVVNSLTGETHTVTYQEPTPVGNGGCANSATEGEALATWADGTHTVVAFTTTGALAAVALQGSVAPSMTLTAVNPAPGDPQTFVIQTDRYAGESALGLLAFQPPDPTACTTPTGATTAAISGVIGLGGA